MLAIPHSDMLTILYDGSWIGFLTAVFDVYQLKCEPVTIGVSGKAEPGMFGRTYSVTNDPVKAARVWDGLSKRLSRRSLADVYSCYLSETQGMEDVLLKYIRLAFKVDGVENALGDPSVLRVTQVAKKVRRERHRMEAFIRFKCTADDIFFATIEPDFNVIPLLVKHFRKRYADQRWLIYDVRRAYGIYYDLESVEEVAIAFDAGRKKGEPLFQEEEELYQVLWKDYFKHVNIPSRKNTKLHLSHMPRRYWKYLIEKEPDVDGY